MTTEEFIEKVNGLSEDERGGLRVYLADTGETCIRNDNDHWNFAYLPRCSRSWTFNTDDKKQIPGCVLKLMGELADSKYRDGAYVILNGKPYNGHFNCFKIDIRGRLNEHNDVSRKDLKGYLYYTKSELDALKANLPWAMQEAIDALTVPLEDALKMGEDDE